MKAGQLEPKEQGRGRPAKARQATDGEATAHLLLQTQVFAKADGHEGHLERCLHRTLTTFLGLRKARLEELARRAQLASGQQPGRAA